MGCALVLLLLLRFGLGVQNDAHTNFDKVLVGWRSDGCKSNQAYSYKGTGLDGLHRRLEERMGQKRPDKSSESTFQIQQKMAPSLSNFQHYSKSNKISVHADKFKMPLENNKLFSNRANDSKKDKLLIPTSVREDQQRMKMSKGLIPENSSLKLLNKNKVDEEKIVANVRHFPALSTNGVHSYAFKVNDKIEVPMENNGTFISAFNSVGNSRMHPCDNTGNRWYLATNFDKDMKNLEKLNDKKLTQVDKLSKPVNGVIFPFDTRSRSTSHLISSIKPNYEIEIRAQGTNIARFSGSTTSLPNLNQESKENVAIFPSYFQIGRPLSPALKITKTFHSQEGLAEQRNKNKKENMFGITVFNLKTNNRQTLFENPSMINTEITPTHYSNALYKKGKESVGQTQYEARTFATEKYTKRPYVENKNAILHQSIPKDRTNLERIPDKIRPQEKYSNKFTGTSEKTGLAIHNTKRNNFAFKALNSRYPEIPSIDKNKEKLSRVESNYEFTQRFSPNGSQAFPFINLSLKHFYNEVSHSNMNIPHQEKQKCEEIQDRIMQVSAVNYRTNNSIMSSHTFSSPKVKDIRNVSSVNHPSHYFKPAKQSFESVRKPIELHPNISRNTLASNGMPPIPYFQTVKFDYPLKGNVEVIKTYPSIATLTFPSKKSEMEDLALNKSRENVRPSQLILSNSSIIQNRQRNHQTKKLSHSLRPSQLNLSNSSIIQNRQRNPQTKKLSHSLRPSQLILSNSSIIQNRQRNPQTKKLSHSLRPSQLILSNSSIIQKRQRNPQTKKLSHSQTPHITASKEKAYILKTLKGSWRSNNEPYQRYFDSSKTMDFLSTLGSIRDNEDALNGIFKKPVGKKDQFFPSFIFSRPEKQCMEEESKRYSKPHSIDMIPFLNYANKRIVPLPIFPTESHEKEGTNHGDKQPQKIFYSNLSRCMQKNNGSPPENNGSSLEHRNLTSFGQQSFNNRYFLNPGPNIKKGPLREVQPQNNIQWILFKNNEDNKLAPTASLEINDKVENSTKPFFLLLKPGMEKSLQLNGSNSYYLNYRFNNSQIISSTPYNLNMMEFSRKNRFDFFDGDDNNGVFKSVDITKELEPEAFDIPSTVQLIFLQESLNDENSIEPSLPYDSRCCSSSFPLNWDGGTADFIVESRNDNTNDKKIDDAINKAIEQDQIYEVITFSTTLVMDENPSDLPISALAIPQNSDSQRTFSPIEMQPTVNEMTSASTLDAASITKIFFSQDKFLTPICKSKKLTPIPDYLDLMADINKVIDKNKSTEDITNNSLDTKNLSPVIRSIKEVKTSKEKLFLLKKAILLIFVLVNSIIGTVVVVAFLLLMVKKVCGRYKNEPSKNEVQDRKPIASFELDLQENSNKGRVQIPPRHPDEKGESRKVDVPNLDFKTKGVCPKERKGFQGFVNAFSVSNCPPLPPTLQPCPKVNLKFIGSNKPFSLNNSRVTVVKPTLSRRLSENAKADESECLLLKPMPARSNSFLRFTEEGYKGTLAPPSSTNVTNLSNLSQTNQDENKSSFPIYSIKRRDKVIKRSYITLPTNKHVPPLSPKGKGQSSNSSRSLNNTSLEEFFKAEKNDELHSFKSLIDMVNNVLL